MTGTLLTVKTAGFELALPQELVTTHLYAYVVIPVDTDDRPRVDVVAPL